MSFECVKLTKPNWKTQASNGRYGCLPCNFGSSLCLLSNLGQFSVT
ncbi:hypothetical protein A2U01_0090566, partial [Trifolium medium]|nr:hypothetical protein [Trifolium medium]